MATLKIGSQGSDVSKLQQLLNRVGFKLDVDGIYGEKTAAAVRDFNEGEGLGILDEVNDNTLSRLTEVAGNVSASKNNTSTTPFSYEDFTYKNYEDSDIVKQAQAALNAQMAQKPGEYNSQWQTQLNDIMDKIQNREKFSYNFNEDALYQQYKDKFIQQGKMAMGDAIGQASAMTGGYGNSYAQSVGQQAYQAQLQNLNDIVPELYQMAYDKYNQEGQDLRNNYAMLVDRENMDYGRHRDSVSDWQSERDYLANRYDSEREYDYSKYVNDRDFAYGTYADDKSYAYSEHRNAIEDAQWQKDFEEAQRQYNESLKFQKEQAKKNNSVGTTYEDDTTHDPEEDDELEEEDPKSAYADWDAGDWNSYFAQIRQKKGKSAAEAELNRMTREGLIPSNMTSYAAIGARGSLGH